MEKEKQIIFLEPWPTVMTYKISRLLKENGYHMICIRILKIDKESEKFYGEVFNEVISFDLSFSKLNLKNFFRIFSDFLEKIKIFFNAAKRIFRLRPYIIIARATPNWPCALTKILFKKYPMIYFPYDIRSIGWDDRRFAKEHGIRGFELKAEKFCFEKADGIMHKGREDEFNYLHESMLGKNLKINAPIINFLPYCSKEFINHRNAKKLSEKDREVHTVYLGSIGSESFNSENYIVKCCKALTEEGIHVHIYTKSNIFSARDTNFLFGGFEEILKSQYFHIHNPLNPKEIIKEISKYDLGLLLVSTPLPEKNPEEKGGLSTSNKISSYLEAGIPWLCDAGCVFICQIMRNYGIELSFSGIDDLTRIKSKLENLNQKELKKKILIAREDFLIEKNFERLNNFLQKVVENHNKTYKNKLNP